MAVTTLLVALLSVVSTVVGVVQGEVIKGISYGPIPLKSMWGASEVPADDWFCDAAEPMWGNSGRADLAIMQQMGANMVRLYGNNPENNHTSFLDEAWARGLSIAPGMSDYPYYQMGGSCLYSTNFDCFSQLKPLYLQNLQKGFLTAAKSYHAALKYVNIINEPDLKMPSTACGSREDIHRMCRAIISAFDGMLEAEKEAGVTGRLINVTSTFSFGLCSSSEFFWGQPALAQMRQLDDAMLHPEKYDYTPRNDITAAYKARFTHSFNTGSPAWYVKAVFFDAYEAAFPATPVYIGEYHSVGQNQVQDVESILNLAENSKLFLGISYFQYQVAYWKAGTERDFGMFGLGSQVVASMPYITKTYDIYCLHPQESSVSGSTLPEAITRAYGGSGVPAESLCVPNPDEVPLNQAGHVQIASQASIPQMALFIERVIHHMGAVVKQGYRAELASLASSYSGDLRKDAFARMVSHIRSRPTWIAFDPEAKCVADRDAAPEIIGSAIDWVCPQAAWICESVPAQCKANTHWVGDYIFSRFAGAAGSPWDPLVNCSFGGAAVFAPKELYMQWSGESSCLDVPASVSNATKGLCAAGFTLFRRDEYCMSGGISSIFGNEASDALVSEAACAATCGEGCAFYFWKEEKWALTARHCSTFSSCASTAAYEDGDAGYVCQKEATAGVSSTSVTTSIATSVPSTSTAISTTIASTTKGLCAAGFTLFRRDVYCISGGISSTFSNEVSGVLVSEAACAATCGEGCAFYFWKEEKWALTARHCSTFSSCASAAAYDDGDAGYVCQKEATAGVSSTSVLTSIATSVPSTASSFTSVTTVAISVPSTGASSTSATTSIATTSIATSMSTSTGRVDTRVTTSGTAASIASKRIATSTTARSSEASTPTTRHEDTKHHDMAVHTHKDEEEEEDVVSLAAPILPQAWMTIIFAVQFAAWAL